MGNVYNCFIPAKRRPGWGQRWRLFLWGPHWPVETQVLSGWWARRHRNEPVEEAKNKQISHTSCMFGQTMSWYTKKQTNKHNDTYNYRLQNLSGDGRQNPLIVILTDAGEDTWQLAAHWPEEDTQCNVDVLQICGRGKNELPYVKKNTI